jgi:hypothetical protein
MWIVPELVALFAALVIASLVGLPGFHRAVQRRRRALRMCLRCGRTVLLGERTCDCESAQ